jgi:hypothetical protein
MQITDEELQNWFTYHAPGEVEIAKYALIRSSALALARIIVHECPPCADTTASIRKLREAVMTANASIACEVKEET